MKFLNNIKVSFVGNGDLDEALRNALDYEYKKLPHYERIDKDEDEHRYLPTHISILLPFDSYHVIATIHFSDGSFELKVCGIIVNPNHIPDCIFLCKLWFLGDNKVSYEVFDDFYDMGEEGGPIKIHNLFATEKTMCKILEQILKYYLGGDRPMYKSDIAYDEGIPLEI